jgi:hypothetical protein
VSAAVAAVPVMMEMKTNLVVVVEEEHLPTKHLLQLFLEKVLQLLSVLLVLLAARATRAVQVDNLEFLE